MATTGGLVRFDGYRFTVYSPENGDLPSSRITALYFSSPDTLWLGTEEGYIGTFDDLRPTQRIHTVSMPWL